MGNTPTKIDSSDDEYQPSYSIPQANGQIRRSTHSSLVNNLLNNSETRRRSKSLLHSRTNGTAGTSSNANKGRHRLTAKEKEQVKEKHAMDLIIKYEQSVDGGFLAPYGCYSFDKLDYDTDIVRRLIIERKLAPFYIPLEDFDENWSDEEIIKIIDGLALHATYNSNLEDFEDVPIGSLKKSNFDHLIDETLSKKEQRRMHSKIFKARLYHKRLSWQETANEIFLEAKMEVKKGKVQDNYLPNDELKLNIYKNGMECPICFLYYPNPLNYSKCCQQPICTECFVQIKRSEPHFPHDEVDPTSGPQDDSEKDPNLLISEPANCPYCATPNFKLTYTAPLFRRTGIGGVPPNLFQSIESTNSTSEKTVLTPTNTRLSQDDAKNISGNEDKSTISESTSINSASKIQLKKATTTSIISSDDIRPTWEIKLNKERARLAKRSANATAIHVSNQLINLGFSPGQNEISTEANQNGTSINVDYDNSVINNTGTITNTNSKKKKKKKKAETIKELEGLEDKMIQEAIKLSLQDQ